MPEEDDKPMSSNHELLIRIDERTKNADEFMRNIQKNMVTQAEFRPVQRIVYGAAGLVGTTVLISILGMVINSANK